MLKDTPSLPVRIAPYWLMMTGYIVEREYTMITFSSGKGKYSIIAHGPNVPTILTIGSDCNDGQVELTIKYLQSLGYHSIVIVER